MLPSKIYYNFLLLLHNLIKTILIYIIYYGMAIVNEAHKRINSCKGDEREQNEGLYSQASEANQSEINASCEFLEQRVHSL